MADGGVASDDTGVEGRDQAMQVDKAFLGLHPKSNGKPSKGFQPKGIGTGSHVVKLTLAVLWTGECRWQKDKPAVKLGEWSRGFLPSASSGGGEKNAD